MKKEYLQYAEHTFAGTGIQITTDGQRHLGAIVGSPSFKEEYVNTIIKEWIEELKVLSKVARVEPHLAYAAYIFGFQHKYTFIMRTIPDISSYLKQLDKAIDDYLIKPILNGHNFNYAERQWYSLPPRLGGLGIIIPSELSNVFYQNSRNVTTELVRRIVNQYELAEKNTNEMKPAKAAIQYKSIKQKEKKRN